MVRISGKKWSQFPERAYLFYDDYTDHSLSTTEEGWNCLRRYAAFLRTTLELESCNYWVRHRKQLVSVSCIGLLACGIAVCFWTRNWWILPSLWLGVGFVNMLTHPTPVRDRESEALAEYAPFWTEAEWNAHAHLLDPACLPTFDADKHGKPWVSAMPVSQQGFSRLMEVLFAPVSFLWRVRRLKHEHFMIRRHCRSCGYNLTGNVSGTCPECGKDVGSVLVSEE